MEKNKMYVITVSTGSYDDHDRNIEFVTDDFDKGSAYVNKMNATYASMVEKVNVFQKDIYPKWVMENPRPVRVQPELIDVPKWTGHKIITKEMREERKKIELENNKLTAQASVPLMEWGKDMQARQEQWIKDNLTPEEYELYLHKNDNYWEIEEAKWL